MTEEYKPLTVTVDKLFAEAVFVYSDSNKNDECSLCREHLMSVPAVTLNQGNINYHISRGACGHTFHEACIDPLTKSGGSCPTCAVPWKTSQIHNSIYDVVSTMQRMKTNDSFFDTKKTATQVQVPPRNPSPVHDSDDLDEM